MYCRNCGAKLPDGAKFCSNCGASLKDAGSSGNTGRTGTAGKRTAPAAPAQSTRSAGGNAGGRNRSAGTPKSGKKGGGLIKVAALAVCGVAAVNVIGAIGDEADPFGDITAGIEEAFEGWSGEDGGSSGWFGEEGDDSGWSGEDSDYSGWFGDEDDSAGYESYDEGGYDDSVDWDFDDGFTPFLETIPVDNPEAMSVLVEHFKESTGGTPAVDHQNVVSFTPEEIDYYVMVEGENVLRERASKIAHRENPEIGEIYVEHFTLPLSNDITQEEFHRRVEEYVRANGPEEVWEENYNLD
ncbi:MAG: zinc ribbon domain-containing protein [Lachnospiraceae bacterium]|nr:zinc ribbon domain-containing protein [Lachnospiraceae bacterium]